MKPTTKKPKSSNRPKSNKAAVSLRSIWSSLQTRRRRFLSRRPHRSFRLTRRRDLPKRPPLPGLFGFSLSTLGFMWKQRRIYGMALVLFFVIASGMIGLVDQGSYSTLSSAIKDVGPAIVGGEVDQFMSTAAIVGMTVTGGLSGSLSEVQQIYLVLLILITWLSVVWILRYFTANGRMPKIRDALYSSGAPLVSTLVIFVIAAIQALPAVIGMILYSAAQASGLLLDGAGAMVVAVALGLLLLLSLYWVSSAFLAAVIVTIPGTYPMSALRAAGDIALGRRLPLIVRVVWLALFLFGIWVILLVPVVLLGDVKWLASIPVVPVFVQALSGFTTLFVSTYIYRLYRRMIDEDSN